MNYKLYVGILLIGLHFNTFSQTITVNDSRNTPEELVNLLIGNNCVPKSNFNISSNRSVAYFNNNSGLFPIQEGVIIRNGIAEYTQGPYTNSNLSSEISTNGDAQLQAISEENGQTETITDVAYLEFDFIPQANNFSFNFLFASNEYGQFQCSFSDVFAIILTDTVTGEITNLAVIPNSNENISVKNIRDSQYNSSCNSINSNLFDTYNANDPSNSSLNMRGHTVIMNASATVIPNNPYTIKFTIGDYKNSGFDSAVFIEAGSLDASFSLGDDFLLCGEGEVVLDSEFTNTTDYSYMWQKNDVALQEENNPSLTISETGTYKLTITNLNTGCTLSDEIIISELQVNDPNDLNVCQSDTTTFNLTLNNHSTLGIDQFSYDILYYNSLSNATNNINIEESNLESYEGNNGDIIYIKLRNKSNNLFCDLRVDFQLIISELEATTPNDIFICASEFQVNIPSQLDSQILNELTAADYSIDYFTSFPDERILNPTRFVFPSTSSSIPIWARLMSNSDENCFDIVNFNINFYDVPLVDILLNVYECSEYTLPTITNGNYFTGSNGTGSELFAGDVITEQTRIYIYNENANGCTSQSTFIVYIAEDFAIPLEHCENYTIPRYENATFYTQPNGPNGTGEIIPTGTVLTTSQTIYFYVEIDGIFCLENEYPIVINELPPVDTLENIVTCNSYTLPTISFGNYYTETNGRGTLLNAGDTISVSQTIYIFNRDTSTNCSDESSFSLEIINLTDFQDINACESYTIPTTSIGNYYTQPIGNGELLNSGLIITEDQTIYFYAPEVTTFPNCTENVSFNITINPIPPVDSLDNLLHCEDDLPRLPILTNGNYFTESNGQGTQLNAGDIISSSQTIYIYNSNTYCNAETRFYVEIRPLPLVDNFTDIFRCEPYQLPALNNGQYFTESGGQGTQLNAGDMISTSQRIYIYNQQNNLASCSNENVFQIFIYNVEVDKLEDQILCEPYTLPTLTSGNYYTASNGQGTQLNAGDIISTSQTIYIYEVEGERFKCSDEHAFTLSIFDEPELGILNTIENCESVTLPTISIPNVTVKFYRDPNKESLIDPSEYTITEVGTHPIYVSAYPTENPNCLTEALFEIKVLPLKDLDIQAGTICIDYETGETTNPFLLESNLDPSLYNVQWFLEGELVGSGPNYSATKAGTYRVETTKLSINTLDCNYNPTEIIVESSSPQFEVNFISSDFSDVYTVEINENNNSLGTYSYSLDNGPFQNSNSFSNVKPGNYTATIRDTSNVCRDYTLNFVALDYPIFFTPNGDGVNDYWNIKDLKDDLSATIKIYSRMGRLITIIKPSGLGWNGLNSNGSLEISNDYWFLVEYKKDDVMAQFRGNFSLLRK